MSADAGGGEGRSVLLHLLKEILGALCHDWVLRCAGDPREAESKTKSSMDTHADVDEKKEKNKSVSITLRLLAWLEDVPPAINLYKTTFEMPLGKQIINIVFLYVHKSSSGGP